MWKKILIGLAAVVAIFVVVVLIQPADYHVERSTQINAPAEVVWAEISDFNQWKGWSHWDKMDPEQKTTITGDPGTVGHSTSWDGEKTGTGKMTITAATAPSDLAIKLEFMTPMAGVANTNFSVKPQADAVDVTWAMDGKNGFMGKMFGLFMGGMDKMIGPAYEDSLANLTTLAEDKAKQQTETADATESEPTE